MEKKKQRKKFFALIRTRIEALKDKRTGECLFIYDYNAFLVTVTTAEYLGVVDTIAADRIFKIGEYYKKARSSDG